ncbi:uncharacterized protein GGS22DRAFT_67380 [Annulohypoxylon maeteangense]|uniref:uncharacterized protein n=1 Tax=Annulohypoxylon maeteangense TaxID=1927788 RepID=UPI00200826B6|nr:uncharacterized protein GGS22DRAFT_67380 [Annulohypoxylon maeteangense]KAI0889105.1 hypothetical protein GGS22DRAFT_67380 [Annulohypoxylon maeteangense]
MNPSGPPQPPKSAAYETGSNPATSTPQEQRRAQEHTPGYNIAERMPPTQPGKIAEATPSSLGYGIRGAPAGEERHGRSQEEMDRSRELEGEQMHPPGEGDVARAVERKAGAAGGRRDLGADLERHYGR